MNAVKKTLRDSAAMRWAMLILISGFTFATYWFQDFLGGIKEIMEQDMGLTSSEFGDILKYTTIANLFGMIMIGGIILDKWGIRLTGIVFGSVAVVGAAITALAASKYFGADKEIMLNWMILGRALFGSGLEILCVLVTRTIVKWFKGYEVALAMAVNMGFGRLGSALSISLSGEISNGSTAPAVVFAATLIGLSLIMFLMYTMFDVKLDRQEGEQTEGNSEDEKFKFSDLIKLIKNNSFIYIVLLCVSFYAAVFPFIQYAKDLLVNKFGFTTELPAGEGTIELFGSTTLGSVSVYVVIFIFALCFSMIPSKMKTKEKRYISLAIIAILFATYLFSLKDVFAIWLNDGAKTASLIPLGSILFTPIFGSYVDKNGKAASLMILGSLLLIFAHVSLSLFHSTTLAYLGLLSLGIAFSLVPAAMWPSVAKIVPESRLGTAYSFMFTIQNWGLFFFFGGIGTVLDMVNADKLDAIRAGDAVYDYTIPILMLVVCGVISIFLSLKLKQSDRKQGYGLELPSN